MAIIGDVSGLVFVDPVGTGYSRALGEGKANDYWGVDEDAASMADFIRSYLIHQRRWSSPKYLAGESYGTIRVSVRSAAGSFGGRSQLRVVAAAGYPSDAKRARISALDNPPSRFWRSRDRSMTSSP